MTCRHSSGDPACSSSPEGMQRQLASTSRYYQDKTSELTAEISALKKEIVRLQAPPDNTKFEILDSEVKGAFLVLKVKYQSCPDCAFEGIKILVYKDAGLKDALRWRTIDPHFRPDKPTNASHAPSPFARFPNTEEGWKLALMLDSLHT